MPKRSTAADRAQLDHPWTHCRDTASDDCDQHDRTRTGGCVALRAWVSVWCVTSGVAASSAAVDSRKSDRACVARPLSIAQPEPTSSTLPPRLARAAARAGSIRTPSDLLSPSLSVPRRPVGRVRRALIVSPRSDTSGSENSLPEVSRHRSQRTTQPVQREPLCAVYVPRPCTPQPPPTAPSQRAQRGLL